MTTMHVLSPRAAPARTMVEAVRDARRWIRETPAPRWEGDAGDKATFLGYVGASIVTWTLLGMSAAALLGQLIYAVA